MKKKKTQFASSIFSTIKLVFVTKGEDCALICLCELVAITFHTDGILSPLVFFFYCICIRVSFIIYTIYIMRGCRNRTECNRI